jgi:hypothetical protein
MEHNNLHTDMTRLLAAPNHGVAVIGRFRLDDRLATMATAATAATAAILAKREHTAMLQRRIVVSRPAGTDAAPRIYTGSDSRSLVAPMAAS